MSFFITLFFMQSLNHYHVLPRANIAPLFQRNDVLASVLDSQVAQHLARAKLRKHAGTRALLMRGTCRPYGGYQRLLRRHGVRRDVVYVPPKWTSTTALTQGAWAG